MAKIRLTQPGFENYSGQMGLLNFVDGLSTLDVDKHKASRLAAVMLIEWEEGGNPSVTQSLLDNTDTGAPVFSSIGDGTDHDRAAGASPALAATPVVMVPAIIAAVNDAKRYTVAELEAIADKDGIKGLREIAEPKGIKSNSIKELIDAILKAG